MRLSWCMRRASPGEWLSNEMPRDVTCAAITSIFLFSRKKTCCRMSSCSAGQASHASTGGMKPVASFGVASARSDFSSRHRGSDS